MTGMWDVRAFIKSRVDDGVTDYAKLSRAVGMNDTYAYQFVHKGSPKKLNEDVRAVWADILGCAPEMLRNDYDPESVPSYRVAPRTLTEKESSLVKEIENAASTVDDVNVAKVAEIISNVLSLDAHYQSVFFSSLDALRLAGKLPNKSAEVLLGIAPQEPEK